MLIEKYREWICSDKANFKDIISFLTLCEGVICDELSWCGDEYIFFHFEATAGMEGLKKILAGSGDDETLAKIQEVEKMIDSQIGDVAKSAGSYKILKRWHEQYKRVFLLAIEKSWEYLEKWGFPLRSVLFDKPKDEDLDTPEAALAYLSGFSHIRWLAKLSEMRAGGINQSR